MELEEAIEILEGIKKGSQDCLNIEAPNNKEDIEHWKNEIEAIETIVNAYNREKARADKIEKEYSKMLTKIDEYEIESIVHGGRINGIRGLD